MTLINEKQITISAAGSRRATYWPSQTLFWSELIDKLKTPTRGTETLAEYLRLTKSKQDELKDVGGYVAGTLAGNRRKANGVLGRDVVTLDLDNIGPGQTQDVIRRIEGLGCAYVLYSTRKHEEVKPRLRALIALDRTVTADEYEPIARKLGALVGIEMCDPSTFEASRLMYWPSCSSDSQYVYQYGDKPFASANGLLATYQNWHNVAEWPEVPGVQQSHVRLAAKQGDPTAKEGVVGAFCKTYDIYQAMDKFLVGEYDSCDDETGRFTFTGGSTVGGAIIYDNGQFLYSHHATDPVGGKLVNSFDLVRLHKFVELDDDAKQDTPSNKLPSYTAMCKLAIADPAVGLLMSQERYDKATQDFERPLEETDINWISKLKVNSSTGTYLKTIGNVRVLLEYDQNLRGRVRKDTFSGRLIGTSPLPWGVREKDSGIFEWTDADDAGLREYVERILGFRSRDIIDDALCNHAEVHSFDPVVDYLNAISWDGVPRLDTLYIDYLGAEDHPYTRAAARKSLVGAVARAMQPGCKFDTMTVVCGKQGIGKSTLFAKLGRNWFSDSVRTFDGKDAAELLQGIWIVEVGELEAFSKTDVKAVRQFLSRCDDQYRAAYARKTEKHLRRCVFFGTTNDHEYLKDTKGNRRFWPIDAESQEPSKSIFDDLNDYEISQLWAEAVIRWRVGEPLIMSRDLEENEAEVRRTGHMDRDSLQGVIEEFVDKPIPYDWLKWDLERRRMFWANGVTGEIKLVQRDKICALEIWRECMLESRGLSRADSNRIVSVLDVIPGWERLGPVRFGAGYGVQKAFRRKYVLQEVPPGTPGNLRVIYGDSGQQGAREAVL